VVLGVQQENTRKAGKAVSDSVTTNYKEIAGDYYFKFVQFAIDHHVGMGKHTQQFIVQITTFAHSSQTSLPACGMIERMIG
jgi:hypothetical protein